MLLFEESLLAHRKSYMFHFICRNSYILKGYTVVICKTDSESLIMKQQPFWIAVHFKVYVSRKLYIFQMKT